MQMQNRALKLTFCLVFIIFFQSARCSTNDIQPKHYTASQLKSLLKVDGIPDEVAWKDANVADNFIQLEPVEGAPASQLSEARVIFDNTAIYISATLYDTHPDSILHQLGNRDQSGDLNSDGFRFGFDPYNLRQSGYVFEVSASGVQSEAFNDDLTFDAVWESAVNINEKGWSVEMKIPYSAIRFPSAKEQIWGVQFARLIRRNREYDQWTLTPKNVQNRMLFWGTMDGINNIDPPLRLSLTPYFSVYSERAPTNDDPVKYQNANSYSGGADIKYGIDERYTLDMTLLPDFSQVQSDNKVKNLSAYETIYEERRPFFKEGTALFSKGGLLYSRRIGRTPGLFYSVSDSLGEGEEIEKNPDRARLINAAKISGRNDHGLGIGLLNAITANTYATIKNQNGEKRKILTEPLSNYNLIIFDQLLKNNSSIYLVNSNVMREGRARDANVTTAEGRFENKKNEYRLRGKYSVSSIREWNNEKKESINGNSYFVSADKISGNSWYGAGYEVIDRKYDKNDLSYLFENDVTSFNGYYSYNLFNPFWKHFKQGSVTIFTNRNGKLSKNNELTSFSAGFNFFLLFNNNWSIYSEYGSNLVNGKDYYEPRVDGKFYSTPANHFASINFTTNYNKPLAFDFGSRGSVASSINNQNWGYYIVPRVRVNDHFNFLLEHFYDIYKNERGFADVMADDSSLFGNRKITTIVNTLSANYLFKNDMSLTCTARHYWSKGSYDQFYLLNTKGELDSYSLNDLHEYDFNSNYLTIDLVYSWQFAPGSSFLITYKNLIESESSDPSGSYFRNLSDVFSDPQTNSISLKFLYYLDYQRVVRR